MTDGSSAAKTPKALRTPKTKSTDAAVKDADTPTTKTKASAKKRKASDAEQEDESGDTVQPIKSGEDDDDASATRPSTPPPTKKAKTTKATPSTPKSSQTGKPSKTPKTPRSSKATKSANMSPKESTTGLKDNDGGVKKERRGSPEVQAIVDGEVKKAEKATGGKLDEPVKQAIHDGVEKDVPGSDGN